MTLSISLTFIALWSSTVTVILQPIIVTTFSDMAREFKAVSFTF